MLTVFDKYRLIAKSLVIIMSVGIVNVDNIAGNGIVGEGTVLFFPQR